MPEFQIEHITKYSYPGPVRDSANQIILYPIKDDYQGSNKAGTYNNRRPGLLTPILTIMAMRLEVSPTVNRIPH